MPGKTVRPGPVRRMLRRLDSLPVASGWQALILLNIAVLIAGLESAYVQVNTTYQFFSLSLLKTPSFLFLLSLDLLVPLTVALLSRRLFMVFLAGQWFLNIILLHYTIFFYNPLTLSTIYHSMHGAASLGIDILGFARWDIIAAVTVLLLIKLLLVQMSRTPDRLMPKVWNMRGLTAICCMAVIWYISMLIYGKTGLSLLWVDSQGHRTATERRLESGTREAVRNIGYIATWIGEWMSGTYRDTDLIYAEMRCADPDAENSPAIRTGQGERDQYWAGLPLPPVGGTVVFIQVESLDFAALSMKVNGHTVVPFIDSLARQSLLLKAFAPHKVGSSNSDYEILNSRVADQNVMYYSYIKDYPDSVVRMLVDKGYQASVFHGLGGKLFNLRSAYAAQGFSVFHFKEDLEAEGYAPSKYIMEHILDEDVFAKAGSDLDPRARQLQFIITMSSHIPFMDPMPIFSGAGGVFSRYVSSLRYMDQSLAAYYALLPAGTVLVLWGDHGSDVPYPLGFPDNRRQVPFLVNVKGNTSWMRSLTDDAGEVLKGDSCRFGEEDVRRQEQAGPLTGRVERAELHPVGRQDTPWLAAHRLFTLCELSHYLHKIFN